jgi:NAD+ synthase
MGASNTAKIPPMNVHGELAAGSAWLVGQLEAAGIERVVIGLSGGVDSAVCATWATRALGAARVTAVSMPYGLLRASRFAASAAESLAHARIVASSLPGVDYRELDIAPTVDAEAQSTGLADELEGLPNDVGLRLALANVKARVRAVRLRYFANRLRGLLLGTENKTEHYLGYFTTGGDEESDLELLGNYLKAEVSTLARALSVPREVIDKAPSADLWTGQTDEGELGFTYADADHVLDLTNCETEFPPEVAAKCAVSSEVAEQVLSRVRATAFKRAAKPVFPRPKAAGRGDSSGRSV